MRKSSSTLLAAAAMLPAACATPGGGPLGIQMFDPNQHVALATPLDGTPDGRCFSDMGYVHALVSGAVGSARVMPESCSDLIAQVRSQAPIGTGTAEERRGNVAMTLVGVSNERCKKYVGFVQTYSNTVNSTFGIGSQIASLIGTLTKGGTSSAFSGVGGTLLGARSTLMTGAFQDRTVELIATAFMRRRGRIREAMDTKLKSPIAQYGVADAVADAIDFHGACSIGAGFQELTELVSSAPRPPARAPAGAPAPAPAGGAAPAGTAPPPESGGG